VSFAHVGGLPLEETLATGGPALLTLLTAVAASFRARFRRGDRGLWQRTGDTAGDLDRPAAR
jgi:hypothetical protein